MTDEHLGCSSRDIFEIAILIEPDYRPRTEIAVDNFKQKFNARDPNGATSILCQLWIWNVIDQCQTNKTIRLWNFRNDVPL